MCGIAGIRMRSPFKGDELSAKITTMIRAIRHRGPDGCGFDPTGQVVLGHCRLAIIDMSDSGHQPIKDLSERFVIVSYSIDSLFQRIKQKFLKITKPSHQSAPSPVTLAQIKKEFGQNNLTVKRMFRVATFLSAEVLFLLEKRQTH